MKKLCAVIVIALTFQFSLKAGTVRVSFLNNDEALQNTLDVLTNNGCSEQDVLVFSQSVKNYYATAFDFDFNKFPKAQDGFYSFAAMRELIAALPHRLPETQHTYDLNCFDTMILLASDQIKTGLRPDENFGPFMESMMTTNGECIAFAATARDAFTYVYAPWYRESTENIFPESMRDSRICLTAAFFRWHVLPMSTSAEKLDVGVMDALQASWRYQNLKFPQQFEVVLCHKVDLQALTISTPHTGLLFHSKTGYTYLEKAGGSGPFVRLDFDDRSDLIPWLSAVFNEQEHKFAHLFATFNDSKIEKLDSN